MTEATHTTPTRADAPSSCCGGPAPNGTDACCAQDAAVKSAGGAGCGCGPTAPADTASKKETGCCG